MEIIFINPDNGFYYYKNGDGNYQTKGLTQLYMEGIVRFVDHIGIRSLDYCKKYYKEIKT